MPSWLDRAKQHAAHVPNSPIAAKLNASDADKAGDQGTNDLVISDILRPNELQSWFIGQHLVEMPLILEK